MYRSLERRVKFIEESDKMIEKNEHQIDDEKDKPDDELAMNDTGQISDTVLPMLKKKLFILQNIQNWKLNMACWVGNI